jgi:hypothetical protein
MLTRANYIQVSSNKYLYDVQLYPAKKGLKEILHFYYDEHFRCQSVFYHSTKPINFDFIRDKSSSVFRSIDDSYSDMFDYRLQLVRTKHLNKTDPLVRIVLRNVPINQVLSIDPTNQMLYIAERLRPFVKHFKCTFINTYKKTNEDIAIKIGTYEEYQMDENGICQTSMKAENTMTIEILNHATSYPTGEKLHDIGMWFSSLCQTCVDLPAKTRITNTLHQSCQWFSDISFYARWYERRSKEIEARQLTVYKTKDTNRVYTSDEITLVKRILRQDNLKNLLVDANDSNPLDRKAIDEKYETITKRLKDCAAPFANKAMQKIQRAYQLLCDDLCE